MIHCNFDKFCKSTLSPYTSFEEYPAAFELEENKKSWYEFNKIVKQNFSKYSHYIHESYLEGLNALSLQINSPPSLSQLNQCLNSWGWQAIWVNGYVPASIYASLIARGYFPIANILRHRAFLKHSPIPDFIHDIYGHLPLLCNQAYSKYIKELATAIENAETNEFDQLLYEAEAKTAYLRHEMISVTSLEFILAETHLKKTQSLAEKFPSPQRQLARIFLWSIEFGLIKTSAKEFTIVGAGILSAPQEFHNVIHNNIQIKSYSLEAIHSNFTYFSDLQPTFYTITDFKEWSVVLSLFLKKENTC